MSARAIGTGTISFGLVSIPVKVFSSNTATNDVSFNLLHQKCGSRVKQQYICPVDNNEVVDRAEMVKGYEFAKGQYVTFTDDELKNLEEEPTKTIEITEFVPADKVDPVYFDKAYYLGPDKGGDKPYKLLREAMHKTGRVALAKYAVRGKQYLVMLREHDTGLVMQQLRYADEVRPFAEVPVGDAAVRDAELNLAIQLIEQIARSEFHPENYADDVKVRMLEQIQRKVDGQEIQAVQPETPKAQIIDLMAALKASLGQIQTPEAATEAPRKPAKRVSGRGGEAKPAKAARSKKA